VWNEALRGSADDNPFLRSEWLGNWWKHFGLESECLVAIAQDGNRILVAAPLMYSRLPFLGLKLTRLQFIASDVSDYLGFLVVERRRDCVQGLLDYVASRGRIVNLRGILENSWSAGTLRQVSRRLMLREDVDSVCPYIPLPTKWEDYFPKLSSRLRSNLLRRERNLRRSYSVDFKIASKPAEVEKALSALFDWHQHRYGMATGMFSSREVRDFHMDVASSFASRGLLAVGVLELNGKPAAVTYNFNYANRLYCYAQAFAPQYSRYGVGSVLEMYMIRDCITRGLREYDFLGGVESYKTRWSRLARRTVRFRGGLGIIPATYKLTARSIEFVSVLARRTPVAKRLHESRLYSMLLRTME